MTRTIGLFAGLFLFATLLVLPTPEDTKPEAMRAAAVALLMAAWWLTEAIPISATALVPLALFPLLGILDARTTATNYGHPFVLLLLCGFIIAKAIEVQNLHKRIALLTIKLLGTSRRLVILSFMVATAFLSMWIANLAVALLMLPIGTAMIAKEAEAGSGESKFGLALMLAIAYSASVGGTGTLIGTPPNMVFAGVVGELYPTAPEISFFQWLLVGIPLVVVMLPLIWLYLIKYFKIEGRFPGSREVVEEELRALGPMTTAERRVLAVFILTSLGWIFRKDFTFGDFTFPGWASLLGVEAYVHDSTVAVVSVLLLFLIPSGRKNQGENGANSRLMDWRAAESVPWGVVIIVGGGYAISNGFSATGFATWLGEQVTFLSGLPTFVVLLCVVFLLTFLTEINSNTATSNIFLTDSRHRRGRQRRQSAPTHAAGNDRLLLRVLLAVRNRPERRRVRQRTPNYPADGSLRLLAELHQHRPRDPDRLRRSLAGLRHHRQRADLGQTVALSEGSWLFLPLTLESLR